MQTPTWRTNVVGGLLIALVCARVYFQHDALFDASTIGIFGAACSLILGTDNLLGIGKR